MEQNYYNFNKSGIHHGEKLNALASNSPKNPWLKLKEHILETKNDVTIDRLYVMSSYAFCLDLWSEQQSQGNSAANREYGKSTAHFSAFGTKCIKYMTHCIEYRFSFM